MIAVVSAVCSSSPTRYILTAAATLHVVAVDWCNLLCVTDQPKQTGNAFGRRCLEDWQMLHGPLPPLLQRYLLAGGRRAVWCAAALKCCFRQGSDWLWVWCSLLSGSCMDSMLPGAPAFKPICAVLASADEGDWFLRLAAWLLWLKRNARGPWRLYIDLLPKVGWEHMKQMHWVFCRRWVLCIGAGAACPVHHSPTATLLCHSPRGR